MNCVECSAAISAKSKTGYCRPCAVRRTAKSRRLPRENCLDCGKELILKNTTHRCISCGNRWRWKQNHNGLAEKQKAGVARLFTDPEYRARNAKACARTSQKLSLDPEIRARRSAAWWHTYNTILNTPEVRARNVAALRLAGPAISEARLSWCPLELRDRYRWLCRSKRMKAAEARAIIEREMAEREALRSGNLDEALFWLKRISPITRQEDGTYRFGYAVLTPAEVIERAKLRGWKPMEQAA